MTLYSIRKQVPLSPLKKYHPFLCDPSDGTLTLKILHFMQYQCRHSFTYILVDVPSVEEGQRGAVVEQRDMIVLQE